MEMQISFRNLVAHPNQSLIKEYTFTLALNAAIQQINHLT